MLHQIWCLLHPDLPHAIGLLLLHFVDRLGKVAILSVKTLYY